MKINNRSRVDKIKILAIQLISSKKKSDLTNLLSQVNKVGFLIFIQSTDLNSINLTINFMDEGKS